VGQAGDHIFQGSYRNLLCQEPAGQQHTLLIVDNTFKPKRY
jgi:hypothetical protein